MSSLIYLGILSCNSGSDDYYEAPVQLSEEELQQQLHDTECSRPADYIDGTLSTQARFKGVLSTKVNGLKLTFNLSSSATLATIKNIDVLISLKSKTGAIFHEQEITIYEFINPGRSVKYKTEIDITNQQWKDLSETSWAIIGSECN
ncbi:MAG: hypothetical protein ACPG21_12230 [Crocinitomicaceae bacterium]